MHHATRWLAFAAAFVLLAVIAAAGAGVRLSFGTGNASAAAPQVQTGAGVLPSTSATLNGGAINQLAAAELTGTATMFVKFEGIDGESADEDHRGWCDLTSFSQGVHQSKPGTTGQANRTSRPVFDDIVLTKPLDKATPKLQEYAVKGTYVPSVTVEVTKLTGDGSRQTYYAIVMKNVFISSYSVSGSSGETPMEQISLVFEEITVSYDEFDATGVNKGHVEYSWKIEQGGQ